MPQGLVLITGPTGSGKTNTLYAAIHQIDDAGEEHRHARGPGRGAAARHHPGRINVKTGMTFAAGLRSILRQDPDIVLVGEVRDGETAELALKASLTGHLVLTTLHTNSAVAALTRLVDMGVEPFLVASSLTAAIAQRLVREPCAACAAAATCPDDDTLTLLGLHRGGHPGRDPAARASAARDCGGTGYRGRTAVYEVLAVDAPMRQVLMKDPTESAVAAQARAQGMVTLRGAALEKARRGRDHLRGGRPGHPQRPRRRQDLPGVRARRRVRHGRLPVVLGRAQPGPVPHVRPPAGPGLDHLPVVPDRRTELSASALVLSSGTPGPGPDGLRPQSLTRLAEPACV